MIKCNVPVNERNWFTPAEAAEVLGIHQTTLQKWKSFGEVPFVKYAGQVRYPKTEIHKILERSKC